METTPFSKRLHDLGWLSVKRERARGRAGRGGQSGRGSDGPFPSLGKPAPSCPAPSCSRPTSCAHIDNLCVRAVCSVIPALTGTGRCSPAAQRQPLGSCPLLPPVPLPLPAGSESAIPAPPSPGAAGSGNLAPAQQCSGVTQLVSVCMCVRGTGDGLPCPRNHSLRPGVYAREHACTHTHTPSPSLHTHKQLLHHCTHTHSPCLLHKPLHHCIHTLPLSIITHTHLLHQVNN